MNKLFNRITSTALALALVAPAFASSAPAGSACVEQGAYVAFYNGVWNSPKEALRGMEELRFRLGDARGGESIRYELMYNPTNGWEDIVQTVEQRLREEDAALAARMEIFWEVLRGEGADSGGILGTIGTVLSTIGQLASDLRAVVTTGAVNAIAALTATPPTTRDYAEQTARLDSVALEGKKILLVGHSQGTLFMNVAYQHLDDMVSLSRVSAGSYGAVYVAPAAAPRAGSRHVLAEQDVVINGLRLIGNVPASNATVPAYLDQLEMGIEEPDASGHFLVETYLNPAFTGSASPLSMIRSAAYATLDSLTTPPARAGSGFFTVTLTWDQAGDVDLHTYEPSGAHIYYLNSVGNSGELDVDNMFGTGPEHYTSTCDTAQLEEGTYTIGVNNYRAPNGTTATVQLSSFAAGPLLTEKVVLGTEQGSAGDDAPRTVMTVTVSKDPSTGLFTVNGASGGAAGRFGYLTHSAHSANGVSGDTVSVTVTNTGTQTITNAAAVCGGGSFYTNGNLSTNTLAPGGTATIECRAAASGSYSAATVRLTGTGAANSGVSFGPF